MCCVVKTCAKYEEIKKRDLFLFFFSLSSVFERFLLSETKKKLDREAFFWLVESQKKKNSRGGGKKPTKNEYTLVIIHTHTSTIMFAATQQIASVAGLKATKVQVRAPRSFLCVPALAFENAVSLSLFFALVETPRVTFGGFWILRIISLRYGKRSHRARCVLSRGVLTDPTSIDRAREERKREHHHRRAQSFFARMNEPHPGAIDHPESTQPDRCERAALLEEDIGRL